MIRANGNIDAAKQMIDQFVIEFQHDLPLLIQAHHEQNWKNIKEIIHKHRGGSLYCGVPRFQQACALLEDYLDLEKKKDREVLYQQVLAEIGKICEVQQQFYHYREKYINQDEIF